MEINRAEAQVALREIEQAMAQARRAIAAGTAAPLLMLWGAIWGAAFGLNYAWPAHETAVWSVADGIGLFCTLAVCWQSMRRGEVHSERTRRLEARFLWFAILLTAYGFLWGSLLKLQDDRQISAFIVMLVMFGYVVLGLWVESVFMLGLGLIVTALTLAGYLLFTETFNLWMALAGGGALLVSGLYMRLKWR
jgi:hypothetical protein